MITLDMVKWGFNSGLINLILSPNGDGIACSIGDNWFYFGGHTAEEYNDVESYKWDVCAEDIINEIYEVLEDFSNDIGFEDEYLYYEYYLREKIRDPEITRNPEGKTVLQIIDRFISEDGATMYTVSLAHGFFVDVKAFDKTGLIYVMENHDGSSVYGIAGPGASIPNYNFDVASVVKFVKDFHIKEASQRKDSLSDQIQSAASRAAAVYSTDKAPAKENTSER